MNRKYKYLKVIQRYCEQGWEDVSEYDQHNPEEIADLKNDAKEYRQMGYPVRIISRRIENTPN